MCVWCELVCGVNNYQNARPVRQVRHGDAVQHPDAQPPLPRRCGSVSPTLSGSPTRLHLGAGTSSMRPIADASTAKPDTGLHSSGCSGIQAASTNHTSAAAGGSRSEQLRCRVDSDSTVLQLLHEVYKWVPGEANVRPTPEVRAQKELLLANLDGMWASPADWVYHHVFGMTTARGANGKRSCVSRPDAGTTVFARNPFLCGANGTEHFVFWMASNEAEWPEQRIRTALRRPSMRKAVGSSSGIPTRR